MIRTFAEHHVRPVASLDGWWDFVIEPDRRDRARLPKKYNRRIHVPCAWETLPGLANYRGRAWMRRTIPAVDNPMRLVFGGVSHTADVYVDGEHLAHHYDAFTPFEVFVPPARRGRGERELIVEVDNSFGDHSALHKENDYYSYGGITRPVECQAVDEIIVDRLHATPHRDGAAWTLDLVITFRNLGDASGRRRVVAAIGDVAAELGACTVQPGKTRTVRARIENLRLEPWTHARPALHELAVTLRDGSTLTDDKIDRVGLREVIVRGRRLLLNGEPIRLRGYNRHEDHPHFGCAIPVEAMLTDLQIMRDLHCNFVRTCHYPNDQRFLDLCDEMGFYVWEESHARQIGFDRPNYTEQITGSTREMIDWHFNHPCILIWGCLNECESRTPAGAREHGRVLKLMKKLDGSRPVTYASMHHKDDKAYRHADIVSWNRYDNWYRDGRGHVAERLAEMLNWLHGSQRSGGRNKPVILSEFGGGAIYGWRQPHANRWTEEYQRDCVDECLAAYLHHPDVVGAAVWQFCDVRLTQGWWSHRPRNMNNKGTVDEYRRPKLVYDTVRRHMAEAEERWG